MRWLRCVGVLLLPLCGWLTGDAYRQWDLLHVQELETTIALLQRIRQEILFRRVDLAGIYDILYSEGVLKDQPEEGTLQTLLPPGVFSVEERRCFLECMQGLGKRCAEQEAQRLEYYLERFAAFREQAVRATDAQAGLPHKLGFAAGAVLALVFW